MKNKHGFTLLEVVIALAILCFVIIGLLSMLTAGQISIFRGGQRSQNTYELQKAAEEIIDTRNIVPYTSTNPSATGSAAVLQITFHTIANPAITVAPLNIPGRVVTINYANSHTPVDMVIYLPN